MRTRIVSLAVITLGIYAPTLSRAADTSFVREFCVAKGVGPLVLFTSGPEARSSAERLVQFVINHPDNRGKYTVENVKIKDISLLPAVVSNKDYERANRVILVSASDSRKALGKDIVDLFPSPIDQIGPVDSYLESVRLRDISQGLAHNVMLYAPDERRLLHLVDEFASWRVAKWSELATPRTTFVSNGVSIFADDRLRISNAWGARKGPRYWNEISVEPLNARDDKTATQLANRSEVYFLDRSSETKWPAALDAIRGELTYDDLTVFTYSKELSPQKSIVVMSGPTAGHTRRLSVQNGRIDDLRQGLTTRTLKDFRAVKSALSTVVVTGADQTRGDLAGAISNDTRLEIERTLRDGGDFGLRILPGGAATGFTLRGLQNGNDAGRLTSDGVRYLWLLELESPRGSVTFTSRESTQVVDPGPFTEKEPRRPNADASQRDVDRYEETHRRWRERRDRHEDTRFRLPVAWERFIESHARVSIHGTLRLIDLRASGGTELWSTPVSGESSRDEIFQHDAVQVRGAARKPDPLPLPVSLDRGPVRLSIEAAKQAAATAMDRLADEALFGSGGDVPSKAQGAASVDRLTADNLVVVSNADPSWSEGTILLIEDKEGNVRVRISTLVNGVAVCVPVGDRDKANLPYIKKGSPVRKAE